ncbi:MAG TPA: MarR family winged helix-turn-helix transcriptional regulator [Streptosporangiaceae bacterium]|nr:MarR family winged helix-turn-helix transcriptional regulator [Streptosporangiaceae bacterium]
MSYALNRRMNLLGAAVLALSDDMNAAAARAAGQAGQAPAALMELAGHPGLTVDGLRRRLKLTHPAVVRLLDRLDERGLIRRRRGGADARVTSITLTGQGQAIATEITAARGAVLEKALLGMTDDQQQHLEQLLETLLADWPRTLDHSCQICRLCDLSACPADRCPVEQRYQQFAGQDSHTP